MTVHSENRELENRNTSQPELKNTDMLYIYIYIYIYIYTH